MMNTASISEYCLLDPESKLTINNLGAFCSERIHPQLWAGILIGLLQKKV